MQSWSNCVDRERDAGNDFTEECREAVSYEKYNMISPGLC